MSNRVEFVLDGKSDGLQRAWKSAADEIANVTAKLREIDRSQTTNAKSGQDQARVLRDFLRSLRETETAQERRNRQLKEFAGLVRNGTVAQQDFETVATRLRQSMNDGDAHLAKHQATVEALPKLWSLAAAGVAFYADAMRDALRTEEQAANQLDALRRRSQVQSGRDAATQAQANKSIERVSTENAVPIEQGYQAETQLVSSGFSAEQASGDALDAFQDVLAAANLTGKSIDPTALANAMASYLTSQGKELTGESIREVGGGLQRLFKSSNIQVTDLEALSKEGAGLKNSIDWRQQVAGMATLKNQGYDASTAATALRNLTGRMGTFIGDKAQVDLLKQMGLSPEDVDLAGESLDQAVSRLNQGLEKLDPTRRKAALEKLFGEAGQGDFLAMSSGLEMFRTTYEQSGDLAGFEADVRTGQSGRNAATTRLQNQQLAGQAERGAPNQDTANKLSLEQELRSRGYAEWQIRMRTEGLQIPLIGNVLPLGYEGMRNYGFSPDTALKYSTSFDGSEADGARRRVEAAQGPPRPTPEAVQQNELLAEQNRLMVEQNRLLREGLRQPGPAPSRPNTAPPSTPTGKLRESMSPRP